MTWRRAMWFIRNKSVGWCFFCIVDSNVLWLSLPTRGLETGACHLSQLHMNWFIFRSIQLLHQIVYSDFLMIAKTSSTNCNHNFGKRLRSSFSKRHMKMATMFAFARLSILFYKDFRNLVCTSLGWGSSSIYNRCQYCRAKLLRRH